MSIAAAGNDIVSDPAAGSVRRFLAPACALLVGCMLAIVTFRSLCDPLWSDELLTTSLLTNSSNKWDVIVLQDQSERPGLAMKKGGSQLAGLNDGGPVLVNDYIEPFQPQARVVLFDTWSRALGNQDLIAGFKPRIGGRHIRVIALAGFPPGRPVIVTDAKKSSMRVSVASLKRSATASRAS